MTTTSHPHLVDISDRIQRSPRTLELSESAQDLLFRQAATANRFSDEPVSDEQIRSVVDLIKYGPTAMNSQPLRIVLVRSPEAKADLLPLMNEGNRDKTEAAPLVAILAADVDFHDELPRVFPVLPDARDLFADEEQRAESARFNAALQIGYFLVGLRAAGLAAGPMGGFDAEAVSRRFFSDGRHQAVLVVNIGHPTSESYRPRLPRLDYDDVVTAA
jgi:3-hydroxypropanoate dehydrogenase